MIERADIARILTGNAPSGIPFDFAVIPRTPLVKPRRLTVQYKPDADQFTPTLDAFDPVPTSIIVYALFTDVAADYYIREAMTPAVIYQLRQRAGRKCAYYDGYLLLRKEMAVLAGLGKVGRNALFHSRKFGFNCKIDLILLDEQVSEYDAVDDRDWQLEHCRDCRLCVDRCPVSAYDDFELKRVVECAEFTRPMYTEVNKEKHCRECIVGCPFSNRLLEECYARNVPREQYFYEVKQGQI